MSEKSDTNFLVWFSIYGVVLIAILAIAGYMGVTFLQLLSLAANFCLVLTSLLMVWATMKTVQATKIVGNISVKPFLHFRIRPKDDYYFANSIAGLKTPKETGTVGIYVRNVGNGAAVNGKLHLEIVGENEKRQYTITIAEIPRGEWETYANREFPNLRIEETDKEIVIKAEYHDILGNKYTQEPEKLMISNKP